MPGVLAVLTGADMLADGLRAHTARRLVRSPESGNPVAEHRWIERRGAAAFPAWPRRLPATPVISWSWSSPRASRRRIAMPPEQVAVEYRPLPSVSHALLAAEAESVRAWNEGASNVCIDAVLGDTGATDAAFAAAAHVARLETWVQRVAGVPMEPRAAIGEHDPVSGKYTLHAGAGGAIRPRNDLAAVLGVPQADVRMVMHDVGGNFGTRGAFNPEFALVVWAARRVGRPVKWTCDRSEAFLSDYQARDLAVTAELALDAEGTFLGLRCDNLVNLGAYPVGFSPLQKGAAIVSSRFTTYRRWPWARGAFHQYGVNAPIPCSAGRPEVMYVIEQLDRSRRAE